MPLVMMTGLPSSGKSRTARKLCSYLEERQKIVHMVSEEGMLPKGKSKNEVFSDSGLEKEVRSAVKSAAVRLLSKDTVVIVDGSNYIKGFRYEVWCASKATKTTQCTVQCDVSPEDARKWNEKRRLGSADTGDCENEDSIPSAVAYDPEVFDGLVMRYETPNADNRWDSPLILQLADDKRPESEGPDSVCEQVFNALFNRAPPPPNQSTQNRPLAQTDFLHKVDKMVSHIEDGLMQSQRSAVEGDQIKVPGTSEHVVWTRRVTRPELSRARRQFMVYLKMRGVDDLDKIHTLFVQYLNSSVFHVGDAENE